MIGQSVFFSCQVYLREIMSALIPAFISDFKWISMVSERDWVTKYVEDITCFIIETKLWIISISKISGSKTTPQFKFLLLIFRLASDLRGIELIFISPTFLCFFLSAMPV